MPQKRHNIISLVFAVAYVVVIQLFAAPDPVFRFLLPAIVLYLAVLGGYNYYFLRSAQRLNLWLWLRPMLFFVSWFLLLFLAPNEIIRGLILLAGLVTGFFIERYLGEASEQFTVNQILVTMFGFFVGVMGLAYYFPVKGVIYFIILLAFTVLTVRSSYEAVKVAISRKWLAAILLSLSVVELFWVLSFLPLHYSALALLLFNLFYLAWILEYNFLSNKLTFKQIQFHLVLAVAFTAIVFLATPWRIIRF